MGTVQEMTVIQDYWRLLGGEIGCKWNFMPQDLSTKVLVWREICMGRMGIRNFSSAMLLSDITAI